MKRPQDYIIFPLDVPTLKEAQRYVEMLSEHVGMFKVGLELFIRSGPEIINFIKTSGTADVFLDLKLHDIPATVARAIEIITDFGVTFVTVHCGETKRMLEAAVESSKGRVGIVDAGFRDEFSTDLSRLVRKRADMAKAAGCIGVVCSGLEVGMIKQASGKDFIAVTPGIRPTWGDRQRDDQQRITTPEQAVVNGSDYLVIGRPIRDAKDPKAAAIRIAKEIEAVI